MDNGKRINAADVQLQLPEDIIQHIQSFLSRKEAASTAVLSKSWYNSWSTRSILDFDERDFRIFPESNDRFLNFVMTSIERYHELKLNIKSFRLSIDVRDDDLCSVATELTAEALQLGADDINLVYNPPMSAFHLPNILFESESLVGLSAAGCRISHSEVRCSMLKSLRLCQVSIRHRMIRDIMLGCPLLENLFLLDCESLMKINVSSIVQLKALTVIRRLTEPLRWRTPLVEFEDQSVGSAIACRPKFSELSYLFLDRVKIDGMLFCDFSSKFPCIKDLTVRYCVGCAGYHISSHSLEYLSLADVRELDIEIDVPNIRKFKFLGARIPSLSIMTASREWESDIALACWSNLRASWFRKLKRLLKILSLSKTTLSIELCRVEHIDCVSNIQDFTQPMVENLILKRCLSSSLCTAMLDGIFWCLRPKIITQCFPPLMSKCEGAKNDALLHQFWRTNNGQLSFLWKKLMNPNNSYCCDSNDNEELIFRHELEEVTAEFPDDSHMKWQPLTWKTLLIALRRLEEELLQKEVRIHFLLRWAT